MMVCDTLHEHDDMEPLSDDEDEEMEEIEETSGAIPVPFDTIDTEDKFRKVILFFESIFAS